MSFQEMIDFVQAGSPYPVLAGPNLPKKPLPFVLLTPYGGGGTQIEGLYETQPWQVRVVGRQAQGDSGKQKASIEAYETAQAIHNYILGPVYPSQWPRRLGATRVQWVNGTRPVPLPADSAGRSHYVASYLFQAATGL